MLESFKANLDLSKEASDIFIWCLTQNLESYKQWVSTSECYFKIYFHSFPTLFPLGLLLYLLTQTCVLYWYLTIESTIDVKFIFFLSHTIHFLHVRFLCIFLFYNVRTSSSFLSLTCFSSSYYQ